MTAIIDTGTPGPDSITGGTGDDTLSGDAGNDTIIGLAGDDSIDGGANDDSLEGGPGDDKMRGGSGNDTLVGGDDQDWLLGQAGDDLLIGGPGTDDVFYFDAPSGINASLATGLVSGGAGNDTLVGFEDLNGSSYADILAGDDGRNYIYGDAGNDTIFAGGESDGVDGVGGDDLIYGGAGNDTLRGGSGSDTLIGGPGDDELDGNEDSDVAQYAGNFTDYVVTVDDNTGELTVTGPEGTDHIVGVGILRFADRDFLVDERGSPQQDTLAGTDASEMIHGRGGDDSISGGAGNDAIYGDDGADSVDGGTGDDYVFGGAGADTLGGGEGDDFLDGGTGDDTMVGGTGNDTYVVDSAGDDVQELADALAKLKELLVLNPGGGIDTVISSINYTLGAFVENLQLASGAGALSGLGNALANTITGNDSANSLEGGAGNDTLVGGGGIDTAHYTGNRSQYTSSETSGVFSLASATEGSDQLREVERITFADANVAIDMQGSAGMAAKILGAVFGPQSVSDATLVGAWIAGFDAGWTFEEGAAAAIASQRFALLAGSHDNGAFVDAVYFNVYAAAPDAATREFLVSVLDSGYITQARMATLAADLDPLLLRLGFDDLTDHGLAFEPQTLAIAPGVDANETLVGSAAADSLFGRGGDDVLTGGAGTDLIDGGGGLDTAVFASLRAAVTVGHTDLGVSVTSGAEVDTLVSVERLRFDDQALAFDLQGHAGTVARIIGAIFGATALHDKALVGQYLAMLDAGMSEEDVAGAAAQSQRFGAEAGGHGDAQFVDRVYFNIVGIHPSQDVLDLFVGILAKPGYSQAYLGALAADSTYNLAHIGLVGLAMTGLDYIV